MSAATSLYTTNHHVRLCQQIPEYDDCDYDGDDDDDDDAAAAAGDADDNDDDDDDDNVTCSYMAFLLKLVVGCRQNTLL